jgi:hypothetical protein
MRRTMAFLAVLVVGALLAPAAAVPGSAKTQRGEFTTLPDGAAIGLEIEGFAQIKRTTDGTAVKAVVRGLEPGATYAAHLHSAPCSDPNPGGGHYKNDPAGPSMPPNELWLSSTDDPRAGITADAGGVWPRGAAAPTGSRARRHSR